MPGKKHVAPERGAAVLIAFGLDMLGEPPVAWHPVVWFGKLIYHLEHAAPQGRVPRLIYGIGILLLAAPFALVPAMMSQRLALFLRASLRKQGHTSTGFLCFALLEGASLKPFFALRMLIRAGHSVRVALEHQDLAGAREELRQLVSRDRSQLTAEQIGAAVIESLAENLSDSVIAPLFYYLLLGLPGAAAYRLFNTFDSMIGYHGEYEQLGKAAARLDDLLNLLPSRLTALLIIITAPLFGGNGRRAWHIWRRDARKTASPNAGHPMAAAAGALGLQLEKVDHYVLGNRDNPIIPARIQQAEQMVWWIGGLVICFVALYKFLRGWPACKI